MYVHIDADRFSDWLSGYPLVGDGRPAFFVYDSADAAYYVNEDGKSLELFLDDVTSGAAVKHVYEKGKKKGFSLTGTVDMFKDNMPYSLLLLVPLVALVALVVMVVYEEAGEPPEQSGTIREGRGRDEIEKEEEKVKEGKKEK